jgi:hypothetical protein
MGALIKSFGEPAEQVEIPHRVCTTAPAAP